MAYWLDPGSTLALSGYKRDQSRQFGLLEQGSEYEDELSEPAVNAIERWIEEAKALPRIVSY